MDEIEAALDEANVVRTARYMRTLADKTQFIVITHRRGTMEAADVLYGVTMQEQGVSQDLDHQSERYGEGTEDSVVYFCPRRDCGAHRGCEIPSFSSETSDRKMRRARWKQQSNVRDELTVEAAELIPSCEGAVGTTAWQKMRKPSAGCAESSAKSRSSLP